MTFKLGLTGSIGMGKSTTSSLFREFGCDVWDADEAVHRLYSKEGAAVAPIEAEFPGAVVDGIVDRAALRNIISKDPSALKRIETIVHPLVAADRAHFIENTRSDIVVFDIPLLFETGGNAAMDAVACVWTDAETQAKRVLARGTMTPDQFDQIVAKQMPSAEKCARSDYLIETDTIDHARAQVMDIVGTIRGHLNA